jgi:hypothetical protein
MQSIVPRILASLVLLGAAGVAALGLAHVAHEDFGLSRHAVRIDALYLALLLSGLLVVVMFSGRFGKR